LDTGVVNAAFIYGPYGEIVDSIGAEEDEHLRRFNGKEADQLSALNYYGYRYYDPLSLTWTQADPLFRRVPDFAGVNPREMTLYAFSMNNPARYMDPNGLQAIPRMIEPTCSSPPAEECEYHVNR
jgi:RHS repeat-associated protein